MNLSIPLKKIVESSNDNVLANNLVVINECLENIKQLKNTDNISDPIFLFKDGPITRAVKNGNLLILEDFDLPSQAVTERLNSLLENQPSFNLTEDLHVNTTCTIKILQKFAIIATVHQDNEFQTLNLSPAALSRFTQLRVEAYDETDIEIMIKNEIIAKMEQFNKIENLNSTILSAMIISLRKIINKKTEFKNDIQQLFRWIDFIFKIEMSKTKFQNEIIKVFLGAKFYYFEEVDYSDQVEILAEWLKHIDVKDELLKAELKRLIEDPTVNEGALDIKDNFIWSKNNASNSVSPFLYYQNSQNIDLEMKYTNIIIHTNQTEKQSIESLTCLPTPTFVKQLAHLFASISTGFPLLLQGPPGIGKTAVISQACKIVNVHCERINCSANTSLDQLFGCVIPQSIDGKRVFKFKKGKLTNAIENKHWVLLDEINLAPPEVLDGLMPLLSSLCSNKTKFTIKDDIDCNIGNLRIFATMNPSNIGGGRTKLPRSIRNLFTIVHLDAYHDDELKLIVKSLFSELVLDTFLTEAQVDQLFEFYLELRKMIVRKDVGRIGGPYDINLRDFTKLNDILQGNYKDQRQHHELLNSNNNSDDFNVSVLQKFLELIFAKQFQKEEDQETIKALICKFFKAKEDVLWETSIDSSLKHTIRIGSVYLDKKENNLCITPPLVLTKKTSSQLEILAAAVKSKRAILIEGDTGSRKTAIVQELARLTGNNLLIIPLHQDIETSNLIGQWMPENSNDAKTVENKVNQELSKIIHTLLFYGLACLDDESLNDFVPILCKTWNQVINFKTDEALKSCEEVISLLIENIDKSKFSKINENFQNYKPKIKKLHKMLSRSNGSELTFRFVESDFIEAIRKGYWVLLDNINSAPQEVIERLNSLIEETPMLNLYEGSESAILTLENKGINEEFRLFATSNMQRISSNKLSSAFLNRVIRIWLPSIDKDINFSENTDPEIKCELYTFLNNKGNSLGKIEPVIKNSDLYKILENNFVGIYGGELLCLTLVKFHALIKYLTENAEIMINEGTQLTLRKALNTVKTFNNIFKKNNDKKINQLVALIISIARNYIYNLARDGDRKRIYEILLHLIRTNMSLMEFLKLILNESTEKSRFKQEIQKMEFEELICSIEETLAEFITALISVSLEKQVNFKFFKNIYNFVSDILVRINKSNRSATEILIQLECNLKEASKTNDYEKAKVAIKDIYQYNGKIVGVDKLFATKKYSNLNKNINERLEMLLNGLIKLAKSSSLYDLKERKEFISCVAARIHVIEELLSNFIEFIPPKENNQIRYSKILQKHLESFSSIEIIFDWYKPFESQLLENMMNEIQNETGKLNERFFMHRFQYESQKPLINSDNSMQKMFKTIRHENKVFSMLERYCLAIEWLKAVWNLRFSIPPFLVFIDLPKKLFSYESFNDRINYIECNLNIEEINDKIILIMKAFVEEDSPSMGQLDRLDFKLKELTEQKNKLEEDKRNLIIMIEKEDEDLKKNKTKSTNFLDKLKLDLHQNYEKNLQLEKNKAELKHNEKGIKTKVIKAIETCISKLNEEIMQNDLYQFVLKLTNERAFQTLTNIIIQMQEFLDFKFKDYSFYNIRIDHMPEELIQSLCKIKEHKDQLLLYSALFLTKTYSGKHFYDKISTRFRIQFINLQTPLDDVNFHATASICDAIFLFEFSSNNQINEIGLLCLKKRLKPKQKLQLKSLYCKKDSRIELWKQKLIESMKNYYIIEDWHSDIDTKDDSKFSHIEIILMELVLFIHNFDDFNVDNNVKNVFFEEAIACRDMIINYLQTQPSTTDDIELAKKSILEIQKLLGSQISYNETSIRTFYKDVRSQNEILNSIKISISNKIQNEISAFYSDSITTQSFILSEIEFKKRYGLFKNYQCFDYILNKLKQKFNKTKLQDLKLFKAYQATLIRISKIFNRLSLWIMHFVLSQKKFEIIDDKTPSIFELFARIKSLIDNSVKINEKTKQINHVNKFDSNSFESWQSELNNSLEGILDKEDDIIFSALGDLKKKWLDLEMDDNVESQLVNNTDSKINNSKLMEKIESKKSLLTQFAQKLQEDPTRPLALINQVRSLKTKLLKAKDQWLQKIITDTELQNSIDFIQKEYMRLEQEFVSHKKMYSPKDLFNQKYNINRETEVLVDFEITNNNWKAINSKEDINELVYLKKKLIEEVRAEIIKLNEWKTLCTINFEIIVWKNLLNNCLNFTSNESLEQVNENLENILKLSSIVSYQLADAIAESKHDTKEKICFVKNLVFNYYHRYRNKQYLDQKNFSETFSSKYLNDYEKLRNFEQKQHHPGKINLLNLESNARYLYQKYKITTECCALYPYIDSFIILPPKLYFSDLVSLFTIKSNNLFDYFIEIDLSFRHELSFQTQLYKDVILNLKETVDSFNTNSPKDAIRLGLDEMPNYLYKSIDKIISEVSELKASDSCLLNCFKDYFDLPQIQFILPLIGILACKLLMSLPINDKIYEYITFKNTEISEIHSKLKSHKSRKNEITEEQNACQIRKDATDSQVLEIEWLIRKIENDEESNNKLKEKDKLEKNIENLLNDIRSKQNESNMIDREIEKLNGELKNQKSSEFQKFCNKLAKVSNEFQIATDLIFSKICDDFDYNCNHLPTSECSNPLNKDDFEQKDYAFNAYTFHARECSLRLLMHILPKLLRLEIKIEAFKDKLGQLKSTNEKLKQQLNEIAGSLDDSDFLAVHLVKITNLLTLFFKGLENSTSNFANLKTHFSPVTW